MRVRIRRFDVQNRFLKLHAVGRSTLTARSRQLHRPRLAQVPRSEGFCLLLLAHRMDPHWSSHRLALPAGYWRCSASPPSTVLWPLLTPVPSTQPLGCAYRFRPGDRSPQVRTLTVPVALPDLLLWPLVASGFVVASQLTRPHSLTSGLCSSSHRFVSGFLQTPPRGDALAFH